jgi:hypothetical protein
MLIIKFLFFPGGRAKLVGGRAAPALGNATILGAMHPVEKDKNLSGNYLN